MAAGASQPYDDRDGVIWYDGHMVPWRDARVHLLTHALHYASSVFEGARAYGGRIFKLNEHSERLHNSAKLMGFQIPFDVATLNKVCNDVLKANNLTDGYVRPIAWRGSEMMGVSAQNNTIHLAVAAWNWPSYYSPEARMKGLRLKTAPWRRPAPDTAPVHAKAAGLYMICTLSKHEVERAGFDDALMLDYRGRVAEATSANIFFIMDGKIHTPVADCFLNGLTRQTVIDLARGLGLSLTERAIMPDELGKAQEVFLTGTAAEVTPVGSIDAFKFTPGKVTRQLMEAYDAAVRGKVPA